MVLSRNRQALTGDVSIRVEDEGIIAGKLAATPLVPLYCSISHIKKLQILAWLFSVPRLTLYATGVRHPVLRGGNLISVTCKLSRHRRGPYATFCKRYTRDTPTRHSQDGRWRSNRKL